MPLTSLVENCLEQVRNVWQVEQKDLRDTGPNGFDWLPGSHLVEVRAVCVNENDPVYIAQRETFGTTPRDGGIRLSVTTRFIDDFPSAESKSVEILNALLPSISSTYSVVYPPIDLQSKLQNINKTTNLELFSSIYVDENLSGWLPHFFAQMALMQPIDAELRSHKLPSLLSGGHPSYQIGQKREAVDGILEVADQIIIPAGSATSRWVGSSEFDALANQLGTTEGWAVNSGHSGLTAEVPFGKDTALIQCFTDQPHPQLGNGLLVTLTLPFDVKQKHVGVTAHALNFFEARAWTEVPQFGCWHSRDTATERGTVAAHAIFVPNALFRSGLVQNLVIWQMARARWVRESFFPHTEDRSMSEIYRDRYKHL